MVFFSRTRKGDIGILELIFPSCVAMGKPGLFPVHPFSYLWCEDVNKTQLVGASCSPTQVDLVISS